jgi:hypothetical protein
VRRLTSGRVGRVIARITAVVILVLLVAFVVVPQYGDAQRALQSVGELSPLLSFSALRWNSRHSPPSRP